MSHIESYDIAVIGGGPAGATAAHELATAGHSVLLIDRPGRIKPCGGAIPPRLIRDFKIPQSLLCARINSARMVSPSDRVVDMPINGGYVGMVNREVFDEFLRERAQEAGAERRNGKYLQSEQLDDGSSVVVYRDADSQREVRARAKVIIGADGAKSQVAKQLVPGAPPPCVSAYHEIVEAPSGSNELYNPSRCDVIYKGAVSPDFYGWVFPHGGTASIGTGTARKGLSIKSSVVDLREAAGLTGARTVRKEGAPIPMKPRRLWDDGRNVVLAGDAAGVVAPASGEGIYYAMVGGQCAAEAAQAFLETGNVRALKHARKKFMKAHGRVFWVLGIMQHFWYRSDKRRERFVSMCKDPDVQELTWQAYMNKELVKAKPAAHMRIFFKDMAHLMGLVAP
ncbi:MAG: geranylgeranyl diphosphate reductase [Myxococcota bacterium]